MALNRLRMAWGGALAIALLMLVLFWQPWHTALPPAPASVPLPQDNLFHPDVVIESRALSQLPKDVLAVPLLKTLLTEEFVFYYQQNESRLTLEGTFRRIAYERGMGVGDEILAYALNTPAQVALWKNKDGKLKNFLFLLEKKGLLRFVEALARLALNDTQLKAASTLHLADGTKYSVWHLQYTPSRAIFFVVLKDYIAIYTDPSLLDSSKDGLRQEHIGQFLQNLGPDSLGSWLRLPPLQGKHRVAVQSSYLSFGYQHFFPALETLRFDYGEGGWTTSILSSTSSASPDTLWGRVPAAPALCLALPVDKSRILSYLQSLSTNAELSELVESLRPPAALCWYGDSQLHTPLAVFPLAQTKESWKPLLTELFTKTVGTAEAKGEQFPVEEVASPGAQEQVWQRSVSSPHGIADARKSPLGKEMRSRRYFPVTFALADDTLIFSPDGMLADRTLAVLNKKYPSMSETLGKSPASVSVAVVPKSLAGLLRQALSESLPPTREQVFRSSVEKRFFPLLDSVAEMSPFVLATPRGTDVWEPLSWHTLSSPSP
ncbi:MAG: DUF2138 family protein [Pseudomonadota bacterium]